MRKNLPSHAPYIGKTVPGVEGYSILEFIKSGNNALVFKAHNPSMNIDRACKIIPQKNQCKNWKEEVLKPNTLRHPAVVKCHNAIDWINDPSGTNSLVLFLDYVHGITLKEYIQKNKNNISIEFIENFLLVMFDLLNEMEQRSITHGDLHAGNIMVEETSYKIRPTSEFRVTDFGVMTATSDFNNEDDYLKVASILKELLENVNYCIGAPRDKFAFNFLKDNFLSRHLIEADKTRDEYCKNPVALESLLRSIDDEYEKINGRDVTQGLETPFEFLSCEQIGSSHTILSSLYSDRFIGLSDIEERKNLILTGPRGCGKTTIFRSLSLRHRYLAKNDKPQDLRYISIYFRCDDLYFAFPKYSIPTRDEAHNLPIHFLTATLLIEILDSLEVWAKRYFEDEFLKLEEKVARQLWNLLEIEKPTQPNSDSFKTLKNSLIREQKRAVEKVRFSNDPNQKFGRYFGVNILIKSCELFLKSYHFLSGKPFYFFIDDYSIPKITAELQKSLNRLLMFRNASCFFKISTESSVSFLNSDSDGKSYVEGREYALLNLGLNFILSETAQKKRFIEDVFSRRLKSAVSFPERDFDRLIGDDSEKKMW